MDPKIKAARQQLGGFFRARREEMGLSYTTVSEAAGISNNTLQGIEAGRFAWEIDIHIKLCNFLKIKLPYEL